MPNVSLLTTLTILSINSWNTFTCFVYFKSKKELNYDRFVDLNILGASDLRIYRISPCFTVKQKFGKPFHETPQKCPSRVGVVIILKK